jgi:hypothetical protein
MSTDSIRVGVHCLLLGYQILDCKICEWQKEVAPRTAASMVAGSNTGHHPHISGGSWNCKKIISNVCL